MLRLTRTHQRELLEAWHVFVTPTETADIRARNVSVIEHVLTVALMDGRTIAVTMAWFPRLANATPAQRAHWEAAGGGYGIHWPEIDEDLNTADLRPGVPGPRGSDSRRSPFMATDGVDDKGG